MVTLTRQTDNAIAASEYAHCFLHELTALMLECAKRHNARIGEIKGSVDFPKDSIIPRVSVSMDLTLMRVEV